MPVKTNDSPFDLLEEEKLPENKSESGASLGLQLMDDKSSKGGTFDDILRGRQLEESKVAGSPSKLEMITPTKQVYKRGNSDLMSLERVDSSQEVVDVERGVKKRNEFSLEHSRTDQSFWSNLKAVLYKRANIYRRNRRNFLYETLIPALVILFGTGLSKISRTKRSPPEIISPDMFPLPQKILINRTPIDHHNTDVTTDELAYNLPMADTAFDINFDSEKRTREDTYKQFGWNVF